MHTESIQSLAHRLKEAQHSEPKRFVFFIGAGASESSGIPIASSLTRDFERKLKDIWEQEHQPLGDFHSWLETKPRWQKNKSSYARLFEAYEPTEYGRVNYLNKWMAAASPGWGYFCLAQLLAQSYLNIIITTNFDDLVYESCTQTSVRRPRVYSTLTPYAPVEHDHDRPTIIKLHGDYLYGNIRNTTGEMQKLDRQLLAAVSSLFQRHEVIVVGYGGTDKLIMDEVFANIPVSNAVYWCTYKDTPVPEQVNQILSNGHSDHWFRVSIKDFDEFMDTLVNHLDFSLPGIIQPIQSLINAIPGRIEGSQSPHVRKYLDEAIRQIEGEEKELARAHGLTSSPPTPYRLRLEAMSARLNRRYDDAIKLYGLLVTLAKQATCEVLIEYAVTLELIGNYSESLALLPSIEARVNEPEDLGNYAWLLANLGRYEEGIAYFDRAINRAPGLRQWQVARAIIVSEHGQVDAAVQYAEELTRMYPDDGAMWAARSRIESLKGSYSSALEYGEMAVKLDPMGFAENLSVAFARSGLGDHKGAIAAVDQIAGEHDEVLLSCLGHFQLLDGDFDSAVESLYRARGFTEPAIRPKILVLLGMGLLAQGSRKEAQESFESACRARNAEWSYKPDDVLAFALCDLGAGRYETAISTVRELSREHRLMKGLLVDLSALLDVMKACGIEGSDECIRLIDVALAEEGS